MALWTPLDYRMIGEQECSLAVDDRPRLPAYDVLLGCLGYEERSSFAPLSLAGDARTLLASAFDDRQVLSFGTNADALSQAGFSIQVHADGDLRPWLAKEVVQRPVTPAPLTVGVDMSSFTRSRTAEVLLALCDVATERRLDVDLLYAPARFKPYVPLDETMTVAGPVAYELSGWPAPLERPVAGVLGLGYEPGRAVGVAEYLDADRLWGFIPAGVTNEYDAAVDSANDLFWVDPTTRRVRYNVLEPFRTFTKMESLTYGLSESHKVVVVPFGPKIFGAVAVLVGLLHPNVVSVWRVSSGDTNEPVDQSAEGLITHLGIRLGPVESDRLLAAEGPGPAA
jgi:hypothetical protein